MYRRIGAWLGGRWRLLHGELSRGFNRVFGPWFYGAWYFNWRFRRPDPWNYQRSEYEAQRYQQLLELIPVRSSRVLELGCAEGHFTRLLAERGAERVLGVDLSERAVHRARQRSAGIEQVEFQRLDIRHEHPAGRFDVVLCCELLYYFRQAAQLGAVRNRIVHMLKEGGLLVLMHPHPASRYLHDVLFGERLELTLVAKELATTTTRPYEIAVYRRRPDEA